MKCVIICPPMEEHLLNIPEVHPVLFRRISEFCDFYHIYSLIIREIKMISNFERAIHQILDISN
jgi:hypothetical protein